MSNESEPGARKKGKGEGILTTGVCGKEEIFGLLLRIKKKKHISFLQRKRVLNKVYSAKKKLFP